MRIMKAKVLIEKRQKLGKARMNSGVGLELEMLGTHGFYMYRCVEKYRQMSEYTYMYFLALSTVETSKIPQQQ